MFKTLLIKEMYETIISGRFFIAAILCIVLIPLGLYVTLKEYEQRLDNYNNAERLYIQRSEGQVTAKFEAEGYRPPSPLSVFAFGLEQFLPSKAITSDGRAILGDSMSGIVKVTNESSLQNPMSILFGKMDFLFNIGFVLSLFVFLFMYSSITGEREQGTLKLLMSNSVPRGIVLIAKILGNYVVFLFPFLVSFIIGLVIVGMSGIYPLSGEGVILEILFILSVSILFLLCIYTLGILISTSTKNSNISVICLLLIWAVFALIIPRLSPMAAQIIKPVESEQVVFNKIQNVRMDVQREQISREDELFTQVLNKYGITNNEYLHLGNSPESNAIENEYDELILPFREEYAGKMRKAASDLQQDHFNAVREQENLTMLISRISPICCFTFILTELAGTGIGEISNFNRYAEQFQERVVQTVYNKYWFRQYGAGMYNILGFWSKPGVDTNNLSVPQMTEYHRETFRNTIGRICPDILLLMLYTVLFFASALVKFLRYDVR